jgi:hypothetical protein
MINNLRMKWLALLSKCFALRERGSSPQYQWDRKLNGPENAQMRRYILLKQYVDNGMMLCCRRTLSTVIVACMTSKDAFQKREDGKSKLVSLYTTKA